MIGLVILALIVGFLLNFFIIRPYLLIKYYGQQGAFTYFKPGLGIATFLRGDSKKFGDSFYWFRKRIEENKDLKWFAFNGLNRVMLFFKDPNMIKDVLNKQDSEFVKGPANFESVEGFSQSGLVTAEGALWKKHRKLISQAFHFEFVRDMIPQIVSISQEMLKKLAQKDLNQVNILDEFQNITAEVVGRVFFGDEFSKYQVNGKSLSKELNQIFTELSDVKREFFVNVLGFKITKLNLFESHRRSNEKKREFKRVCESLIREKKANPTGNTHNLINILLQHQTDSSKEFLTDDEIIDEYITFFIAGMDTTAHLITRIIYALTQNPGTLEALQKEIDAVFGTDITSVDMEKLGKLNYSQALIKEVLRLWSPAPMTMMRIATRDTTVCDVKVKKGTRVSLYFHGNNVDEQFYEEPMKFKPERWFSEEQEKKLRQNPYLNIPFSAGPRNCIGQHLAQIEAKIILMYFVRMFKFEMADKNYVLRMGTKFLYEPLDPIKLNLMSI